MPDNCFRRNSLNLIGSGIGLSSVHSRFESCLVNRFLLCICSFVSFLWILFVRIKSEQIFRIKVADNQHFLFLPQCVPTLQVLFKLAGSSPLLFGKGLTFLGYSDPDGRLLSSLLAVSKT